MSECVRVMMVRSRLSVSVRVVTSLSFSLPRRCIANFYVHPTTYLSTLSISLPHPLPRSECAVVWVGVVDA